MKRVRLELFQLTIVGKSSVKRPPSDRKRPARIRSDAYGIVQDVVLVEHGIEVRASRLCSENFLHAVAQGVIIGIVSS